MPLVRVRCVGRGLRGTTNLSTTQTGCSANNNTTIVNLKSPSLLLLVSSVPCFALPFMLTHRPTAYAAKTRGRRKQGGLYRGGGWACHRLTMEQRSASTGRDLPTEAVAALLVCLCDLCLSCEHWHSEKVSAFSFQKREELGAVPRCCGGCRRLGLAGLLVWPRLSLMKVKGMHALGKSTK